MPNVITTIRPTTELEAVNEMLAEVGESPLPAGTDLSTATQADIAVAINILRKTTRDVLAAGWRFNTEMGVQIAPTATYVWLDRSGVSTTLNVFKCPVDRLSWRQTKCSDNASLDLVERPSKFYVEAALPVLVLYDRAKNRDGAQASLYPYVYLDLTYAFDFTMLPESARGFITMRAARSFSQQILGSGELRSFTQQDEAAAYRSLKRDQGLLNNINMLQTAGARNLLGRRPYNDGSFSARVYPGK